MKPITVNIKAEPTSTYSLLRNSGLVINSTTSINGIKNIQTEHEDGKIQKDGFVVINPQQNINNV